MVILDSSKSRGEQTALWLREVPQWVLPQICRSRLSQAATEDPLCFTPPQFSQNICMCLGLFSFFSVFLLTLQEKQLGFKYQRKVHWQDRLWLWHGNYWESDRKQALKVSTKAQGRIFFKYKIKFLLLQRQRWWLQPAFHWNLKLSLFLAIAEYGSWSVCTRRIYWWWKRDLILYHSRGLDLCIFMFSFHIILYSFKLFFLFRNTGHTQMYWQICD